MSTPSEQSDRFTRQAEIPVRRRASHAINEPALRRTLQLVEQSLDGPQAILVLPDDGDSILIGGDNLDLDDACRERLIAAIEGSDIATSANDPDAGNTVISDVLILEPGQPGIRWVAAGLEFGGALVACAPEPWEPAERDHAILLGFARILEEQFITQRASPPRADSQLKDIIVESARDGVIGIDPDAQCRYINQTAADLIGSAPDDLIGAPLSGVFHYASADQGGNLLQIDLNEPGDYTEAVLQRPDGSSVPVEISILPVAEASGEIDGAVLRFSDLRDRKAVAAVAKRHQAWHQAFLDMTLDSVITIDRDGRIQELNQAAERTFQISAPEVLGQEIGQTLISPSSQEAWISTFEALRADPGDELLARRIQLNGIQQDRTEFPVDCTLTRIPGVDDAIYILYIHDLTDQRWNEQRRHTRNAVTHILAETDSPRQALPSVLEVICTGLRWDWAGWWMRVPGANRMEIELVWHAESVDASALERASQANGFEPGYGFLGDIWIQQQSGWIEDLASSGDDYRRSDLARAAGFTTVAAMPILGRSEIMGIVEFHSRRRRERDPELSRLLDSLGSQIGQFIERKQVEEERVQLLAREQTARAEAEAAERRLSFLAEASAQLSTSLDYEVTLSNIARLAVPRLADYCAIDMLYDDGQIRSLEIADIDPAKEAIGRQMQADHPVDPESNHPVAQVLRSRRPIMFSDVDDDVLRLFAEDDEAYLNALREIGVDSSMYVPLVAQGRAIGAISFVASESGQRYGPSDLALAQELTRRAAMAIDNARLYREAQEAVRAREEFLSIASHELKTPLTTVKGYAQILGRLLRRPAVDTNRLIRLTDQLQEQLARFETLIVDLLDVSRIQQRGLELRPEPTDLVALIRTVVSRFEYPGEMQDQHTFTLDAPDSITGTWDPDRLDQVLTNLVSNAVKYSPDGGEIQVSASLSEDDEVEFAVADHGIGIPEDEQPQLFRPFARSETVQRAISGVGLGLYISQQIVNRHGGVIWLESKPGVGSRFVVRLPRYYDALLHGNSTPSEASQ